MPLFDFCCCCCCFKQRLVSIPELLSGIKLLCMRFQPDLVTAVDDLRLDILLRMLKSPHFSAKMNSLKEVGLLFVCLCARTHVHVCRWDGLLISHRNHNLKKRGGTIFPDKLCCLSKSSVRNKYQNKLI